RSRDQEGDRPRDAPSDRGHHADGPGDDGPGRERCGIRWQLDARVVVGESLSQATHRLAFRITASAVLMLSGAGCAFKVVHTPPLIVSDPQTGVVRVVN